LKDAEWIAGLVRHGLVRASYSTALLTLAGTLIFTALISSWISHSR
jgi:hypothetical protein